MESAQRNSIFINHSDLQYDAFYRGCKISRNKR
uniref:Uncharacterized protein n=1 Tax=Anguilla anguilla TaxID=7936 RepID=A0A0E9SKP0_ANGAN